MGKKGGYVILYSPTVREAFEIIAKKNYRLAVKIQTLIEEQKDKLPNINIFQKGDIKVFFEMQQRNRTITVTDLFLGNKSLLYSDTENSLI